MTTLASVITLPETAFHISRFLNRSDIKQCTQVCRNFHAAFFPILCESVGISGENGELMGVSVLHMYAQHVRYLTVDGSLPQEYYGIEFKHLERLELESSSLLFTCLCPAPLAEINPSIKDLIVSYMTPGPSAAFWDAVYSKWKNPRSLVVKGDSVPEEVADAFWRACSRFERVVLYDIDIHLTSNTLLSTYEYQVKSLDLSLHLHHKTFLDPFTQLALIQACPELTCLNWKVRHCNEALYSAFLESIHHSPLPNVETLKFDMYTRSSDVYILLLERLSRLRNLDLPQGLDNVRAFACLRSHHFGTLESLTLGALPPRASRPALEVLTQCRKLRHFDAPFITIEDIVGSPSLPWVCTQLEVLRIHIVKQDQDPEEWDFQVFAQLSRLTQLRCLDLSRRGIGSEDFQVATDGTSVNLTLAAGLGALACCRKLETVAMAYTHQELAEKDILWMADQWPRLKSLEGSMSRNDGHHKVLAAVLEARGVATRKCPHPQYYR